MAATQTLRNRLAARFELWDGNHDGRLQREDLLGEARRVLGAFGESESSPRGKAVMSGYEGIWDYLAAQSGNKNALTREQFEQVGADIMRSGSEGWAAVLRPHTTAMVQLCDTDGDGQVEQAEFSKWLKAVGANIDTAAAFEQIDTNHDGKLSIDELTAAVKADGEGKLEFSLLG